MATVLVVEDDPFLRSIITAKLESAGYKVEEAVDGPEGVQKTKEAKPDIILLDLILPTLGGFDVLQQIKADATSAAIPVVILSNLDQKSDLEKGMQLGATAFMVKAQSTPSEIVAKVQEILSVKPQQ